MLEEQEKNGVGSLCCCEYIDNNEEKSHLLAACCNCEDLDLVFTRWITCGKVSNKGNIDKMLITFQSRLRIPWRGGAKQISFSVLGPVVEIPIFIAFAALNAFATIIVFIANMALMCYLHYYVRARKMRSNYFPAFLLWSAVYMMFFFHLTVPLFEVLPEENCLLVFLTGCAIFCLYRTYTRASLNQVVLLERSNENNANVDDVTALLIEPDLSDNEPTATSINVTANVINTNQCKRCSKEALTSHCDVCSLCVLQRSHHSYWLNCCIGKLNYRYYILGCVFSQLALLFGSNLILTAICHPVLVLRILGISIMMPDDCSEVYDDYRFGIAFVIANYALILAFFILVECIRLILTLLKNIRHERNSRRHQQLIRNANRTFSSYAN